jgi:putative tricarboxylic transport membrane protein
MQLSDRITGAFLVVLGGAAAYGGSLLPPVPGQQIGPKVFPIVIGVGHRFEEAAEADPAISIAPTEAERKPGWARGLLALLPPGLLLFYVLTVDRLGFALTAAAMVLATAMALGARLRLAVPLAIVAPVFVHLVFYKLLRVPLPAGLLPMPW